MPSLYIPKLERFEVPSDSRPGLKHEVWISERGDTQCSCHAHAYGATGRCKHIRKVLEARRAWAAKGCGTGRKARPC